MSRPAPSSPSRAVDGRHTSVAEHRAAGIAAQPEPVERGGDVEAGGVARHEPQRRAARPPRPGGWSTRTSRPHRPTSPSSCWRSAPRSSPSDRRACRAAPRTGCASRSRRTPASTGACRPRSPGARRRGRAARSPRSRCSACTRPSPCCRTPQRAVARPGRHRRASRPSPPTSVALSSPSSPRSPRAVTAARGKVPLPSTSAAAGSTMLVTISSSTSRNGWCSHARSPIGRWIMAVPPCG